MDSRLVQIVLVALLVRRVLARQCSNEDFNYEYTQCDGSGERWRIALPKDHKTSCENAIPPKSVNCSLSCPPGHNLDAQTQECRVCPPGTYSLGNATRYEDFTQLPSGFNVENFADDSQQIFSNFGSNSPTSCPKGVGWVVSNGEIRYQPTLCVSRLSISLHLVKDGYIELYYQFPKNRFGLITDIVIKNEQCESNRASSIFSHRRQQAEEEISSNNDWRSKRFTVRRGQNVLIWTVTSNSELTSLTDVIRLAKVDIVGLGFTPICNQCPAGTYSGTGASVCVSCGANSFSKRGSSNCQACQINEYSGPKSGVCHQKPLCRNFDYYPVYGTCSASKTILTFHRIKPLICQFNAPTSIQTPQNQIEPCRNCNPGMRRNSMTAQCEYCQKGEYSNGKECLKCANQTIPNYGLFYTNFEQMPNLMSSICEYMATEDIEECTSDSWLPLGNRIETAPTRARGVALELMLNLTDGFYDPLRDSDSTDEPISRLSMDFETQCADESCQLYIVLTNLDRGGQNKNTGFQFIGAYSGTQRRTRFEFAVEQNSPSRFVFAFMRSGAATGQDNINDRAAIYSLNITNVGNEKTKQITGGADSCRPCPRKNNQGECRPCQKGHYIDEKSGQCAKCPEGTALNKTSNRVGVQSCIQCPEHMGSELRDDCSFSGKLTLMSSENKKMNFDMSPLMNTTLQANGLKIYPREGNAYYRSYNVSLFNKPIQCQDTLENAIFDSNGAERNTNANSNAKFCRSTAMPISQLSSGNQTSKKGKIAFISSYVISTKLDLITQDRRYKGFELSDKQLEYDSDSKANRPIDVHFFFKQNPRKSGNCLNGTLGVVTMRCQSLAVKEPQVRLSRNCPDGTCDGCLFHVIVESSYGCPICDSDDFEEIRGECQNGYQTIHSIPSKHCVLSGVQNKERTETCSNFSANSRLFFFLAVLLITFLLIVIVIIYQKNKTLEYRYSRIVEGKEPEDLNCGLTSDEEDEDPNQTRVFFNKKRSATENGADKYKVTVGKPIRNGQNPLNEQELADFLSDSSD